MTDVLFPPWLRVEGVAPNMAGSSSESSSIFTKRAWITSGSGDLWKMSLRVSNASDLTDPEKSAYAAFIGRMQGKANAVWLGKPGYRQRGSFPSTELFTNNAFASGTTGWTTTAGGTLTVSDRIARLTAAAPGGYLEFYQNVATTQFATYACRALIIDGQASSGKTIGPFVEGGEGNNYTSVRGLATASATVNLTASSNGISGWTADEVAGAYYQVGYASLARCFRVDNGANLILYSDQFDNAAYIKVVGSISAGSATDPMGTATADALVEPAGTSNPELYQAITVSASAWDYAWTVCAKKGARDYIVVMMTETTGSTNVYQVFNLNTGAKGATSTTGANWSNLRSFIRDIGNGWYACTIVARKTNAATTIRADVFANSTDSGSTYLMANGTSACHLWRATFTQSSVPTRLVQTTSAAVAATAQTGSKIYVKGGPASAAGSLLAGDLVQIGNQLQQLTAPLNFDAAGLGYLEMHRPMRSSPADNATVIVNNPMGRFRSVDDETAWEEKPGNVADYQLNFVEALDE